MDHTESEILTRGADEQVKKAGQLATRGETAAALETLGAVLRNFPDHIAGLRLRAALRVRMATYDEAISDFDRLVDVEADQAGNHHERAMAHLLAGHLCRAVADLDRCLVLDPTFAPAYSIRAGIHVRSGRYEAALVDIDKALQIRPDDPGDLHNRAVVLTALERYEEAIREYRRVIDRDPHSAGSCNNLAWLLVTAKDPAVRDGRRALAYAKEAVKRADSPAWLDTLAAAYAECGHFPRAAATAAEAYQRSDPPNERFRRRIEIYRKYQTLAAWREKRRGTSEGESHEDRRTHRT